MYLKQIAAIKLYEKLEFKITSPFGHYKVDPLRIFMEKKLQLKALK